METILTDENFDKEIIAQGAPAGPNGYPLVLVDFFADWCEPCAVLGPILEKAAEHFKEKIILLKANLDNTPMTAQKFGVEKIPTVMLFKNGKPINGFVGLMPENAIKEWLENIIKQK